MARLFTLTAVVLCAVLAGCGSSDDGDKDSGSDSAAKLTEPIVIGAANAESGDMAAFDQPPLQAFKFAIDDINEAGGIGGQQVELIESDTKSTLPGARQAAEDLLGQGADILLATCNFDFGSPAAQVAQAKGVLVFSLCAASPKFGVQGIGNMAFTAGYPTYAEGNVMAQFGVEKFGKNVFILCDNTIDYGTEICQGAHEQLDRLGANVVGEETFKATDTKIASQVTAIKNAPNVDWILFATLPPGAPPALRQIRAAGIDLPIVSTMSMDGTYWTEAVPEIGEFYGLAPASIWGDDPNEKITEIVERYKEQEGAEPAAGFFLSGYSAMQLIQKAIEEKGTTEGAELVSALEAFEGVETLLGPTTFTPEQHMDTTRPITIIKYTDNKPGFDSTVDPEQPIDLHLGG